MYVFKKILLFIYIFVYYLINNDITLKVNFIDQNMHYYFCKSVYYPCVF